MCEGPEVRNNTVCLGKSGYFGREEGRALCRGRSVGQERQAEVSLGRVLGSDCRVRIDPDLPRWPRPSPQVLLAAPPPSLTRHAALGYSHQFSGLSLPGDSTLHHACHTAGAWQSFLKTSVRCSMDGCGGGESGSRNGGLSMGRLQP